MGKLELKLAFQNGALAIFEAKELEDLSPEVTGRIQQILENTLDEKFEKWYEGMKPLFHMMGKLS